MISKTTSRTRRRNDPPRPEPLVRGPRRPRIGRMEPVPDQAVYSSMRKQSGAAEIMSKAFVLSCAMLVALVGCGRTVGEQALFGGGAGAIGSAALGGDPVAGAAVGAGGNILFCQAYPDRC
jgi:osmotically inducible lipoprotein OsmB